MDHGEWGGHQHRHRDHHHHHRHPRDHSHPRVVAVHSAHPALGVTHSHSLTRSGSRNPRSSGGEGFPRSRRPPPQTNLLFHHRHSGTNYDYESWQSRRGSRGKVKEKSTKGLRVLPYAPPPTPLEWKTSTRPQPPVAFVQPNHHHRHHTLARSNSVGIPGGFSSRFHHQPQHGPSSKIKVYRVPSYPQELDDEDRIRWPQNQPQFFQSRFSSFYSPFETAKRAEVRGHEERTSPRLRGHHEERTSPKLRGHEPLERTTSSTVQAVLVSPARTNSSRSNATSDESEISIKFADEDENEERPISFQDEIRRKTNQFQKMNQNPAKNFLQPKKSRSFNTAAKPVVGEGAFNIHKWILESDQRVRSATPTSGFGGHKDEPEDLRHGAISARYRCKQCGSRNSVVLPAPDLTTSNGNLNSFKRLKQPLIRSRHLTLEEIKKLTNFRRFLRSAGVGYHDFIERVMKIWAKEKEEWFNAVDENGVPEKQRKRRLFNRQEDEEEFREFLDLVAVILCSDVEIGPQTFQKVTRGHEVPDRLYVLVDRSTDGLVTADQVMEFIAGLQSMSPRTELTEENLKWLENVFRQTVGENGEIRLQDFKNIVLSKNPFFVERVFHIFDKDDNGSISLQEFIDAMHQFAGQSPDDKIKFLFKVYDIDGDGLIQEKELQHVMRACMDENGMRFDEGEVDELTRALFHDAVTFQRISNAGMQPGLQGGAGGVPVSNKRLAANGITFEALKAQLTKHDGLLQNLTISIDRWLVPPKPKKPSSWWDRLTSSVPHQFSGPYLRNNFDFMSFTLLLIVINLGLVIARIYEFRNFKNSDGVSTNYWVIVARCCGQALNFNSMFLLVLMLRLIITKLREYGLNLLLPLDRHIYFHKVIGRLVFVFALIHTAAHIGNLVFNAVPNATGLLVANGIPLVNYNPPAVGEPNYRFHEWLLTDRPGLFGLIPGWANPTGVALLAILAVMVVCSMKWVRKGGYFEIFYWTHLLYVFYWALLILHAPVFWKWFIIPCVLFLVEKAYRIGNSLSQKGKSWVTTGVILPSRVVSLVIRRPPHFHFKPGDYIFVNIPAIAMFEWHPFTVSSAPEQADVLSLHIRVVGHWTSKLYEYFEAEQKRLECTLNGGRCVEPASKFERFQATVSAAKERARKTSITVLGGTYVPPPTSPSSPSRFGGHRHQITVSGGGVRPQGGGRASTSIQPATIVELDEEINNNFEGNKIRIVHKCSYDGEDNPGFKSDNTDPRVRRDGVTRLKETEINRITLDGNSSNVEDDDDEGHKEDKTKAEEAAEDPHDHHGHGDSSKRKSSEAQMIARNFRYMRRKPTIMMYEPPINDEVQVVVTTSDDVEQGQEGHGLTSSDHYVLDRIAAADLREAGGGQTEVTNRKTVVPIRERSKFSTTTAYARDQIQASSPNHGNHDDNFNQINNQNSPYDYEDNANARLRVKKIHSSDNLVRLTKPLVVYIDGPFGAPTSQIFRAQHAVLIGTGIGVTPFASILQSIMHRYWQARKTCPKCNYQWTDDLSASVLNLRKVDFFWINRDQRSFEWFVNLLSQLEIEQAELGGAMERFLDMHMYITSALQKTDMKAVGLQLALDLLHKKSKRDLITGLKTRTNAGRPNWDKVFKQIKEQQKGKVTVFFCGSPQLGKILKKKCDEFGFDYRKENF